MWIANFVHTRNYYAHKLSTCRVFRITIGLLVGMAGEDEALSQATLQFNGGSLGTRQVLHSSVTLCSHQQHSYDEVMRTAIGKYAQINGNNRAVEICCIAGL
jgi:hypothetical protein